MNTSTVDDLYTNSVEKFHESLQKKSDRELIIYTVEKFEESYCHRRKPFHSSHEVIDRIRDEFKRRGKENLFSLAFQKFKNDTSMDKKEDR
jgi:uncharacterized protein (DUF2344 family)